MFYLGIDVSKSFHKCVILNNDGEIVAKAFTIPSSRQDFAKILAKLNELKINSSDIICAMEATGNLWENLFAFLENHHMKVVLLNPFQTHKYHQALMKKAKTDAVDALLIAGILRSGISAHSHIPDEQIQSLRELVRLKNSFANTLKSFKRKALTLLNLIFPELLDIIKDPFNIVSSHILLHFQTAVDFSKLKSSDILKIARSHQGNNYDEVLAQKIISAAKISIFSGKSNKARSLALKSLISQIINFKNQIALIELEIEELLNPSQDDDNNSPADILMSIPGVGKHTAAAFLAEVGDIHRFDSCKNFIGFVGFFPQIFQSGKSLNSAKLSSKGSRILKHALYLSSVACLKHNPYFKNIYNLKKSQGKSSKQALIVVARKLASIMYSLLKNNSLYDQNILSTFA
jgi:transposase